MIEKTPIQKSVDEWLALGRHQNLRDSLHEWLALGKVPKPPERTKPEPEFTRNQFEEARKKVSRYRKKMAKDTVMSEKQISRICMEEFKLLHNITDAMLREDDIETYLLSSLPPEVEVKIYNQAIAKAQAQITWKLAFEEGRKAGLKEARR